MKKMKEKEVREDDMEKVKIIIIINDASAAFCQG